MIKLNKIYTRTGDDGTTGLVRGPRRLKSDLRVIAYGTIEEANALIGAARLYTGNLPRVDGALSRIQNDLFDAGSDFATPGADAPEDKTLRVMPRQVSWLEAQIDSYNAQLSALTSFVLPGGSALSTALHIARTVVRRAERDAVALKEVEPDMHGQALSYLNRLSDLLFVLARYANGEGARDVLWQPGRFSGQSAPEGRPAAGAVSTEDDDS